MDLVALKFIAIGLSAVSMLGASLGLSKMFSAMLNGIARNPESEDKMKKYIYVGAGFIESIALFAFVIALLLIFAI